MGLLDLPEEILIMIIRYLEFRTVLVLYNTCRRLRILASMNGLIKQCNMSMNSMATVNTLKLDFFKDVSSHLQELNMCGVPDLSKSLVISALKRLKSLKYLDVSYTSLHIFDLISIPEICPTLKDISVNFTFGKPGIVKCPPNTLLKLQTFFHQFENIHFIGSQYSLLDSKLSLYLLKKAKLKSLIYSISESDYMYSTIIPPECNEGPQLDNFFIYLLNMNLQNVIHTISPTIFPVLSMFDMTKYEFIVITMPDFGEQSVFASPVLIDFLKEHFNIKVESITYFQNAQILLRNAAVLLWNKHTNNFNNFFFNKLRKDLNMYLPYHFQVPCESEVPKEYDWFYTSPTPSGVKDLNQNNTHTSKKSRLAPPNLMLDYDTVFKERDNVKLSIVFKSYITNPIALSPHSQYLRKLTFLSLSDMAVGHTNYSSEFFNVLFRCCVNLVTLNVQHSHLLFKCAQSLSRAIPLSCSLKNIRIVDYNIDFKTLFSSFSQCKTLENIHVCDVNENGTNSLADPGIILERCDNLYRFYIEASITETTLKKTLRMFNVAKKRCNKRTVNVVVHSKKDRNYRYLYYPFVDVFKVSPIRPL